jgi:hypothetical protein
LAAGMYRQWQVHIFRIKELGTSEEGGGRCPK